jgi:hypothetical protein
MRYYKTTDIGLASALIATGEELLETQRSFNNPRVFFVFDWEVGDKANSYYESKLQVDAYSLINAREKLIKEIKNEKNF